MSRTRLLHPGFFTNSTLGSMAMGERLAFQGLWCVADREGRMEDDPKRLKVEILPYDKVNMDRILEDLAAAGFILRYESGGARYIQIVNFTKYQTPNVRERASTIPAPDEHSTSTVLSQDETSSRSAVRVPVRVAVPVIVPGACDPVGVLLRHWEHETGTTITPALSDWLESELEIATPEDWLMDAIHETGANGKKGWKYTKAIIDRWKVEGRDRQKPERSTGYELDNKPAVWTYFPGIDAYNDEKEDAMAAAGNPTIEYLARHKL